MTIDTAWNSKTKCGRRTAIIMATVVLAVLATAVCAQMSEASDAESSGDGWTLDDDGVLTVSANNSTGWDVNAVKKVIIGVGVTSFGTNPFGGCPNLAEIVVDEDNVHYCSIDGVLFNYQTNSSTGSIDKNKLILIKYPRAKTIEANGETPENTYVMPDNVVKTGQNSFSNSKNLVSVTISAKMLDVGTGSFLNCPRLEKILVGEGASLYISHEGMLINKSTRTLIFCPTGTTVVDYTVPDYVSTILAQAFENCENLVSIDTNRVTTIGSSAFIGCSNLTNVVMDNVVSIGEFAFRDCGSLKFFSKDDSKNNLPDGLVSAGTHAFYRCDSLTVNKLPESLVTIGSYLFRGCSGIVEFDMGDRDTIGKHMFKECLNLASIRMDKVKTIDEYAFDGCIGLGTVKGEGVNVIGQCAFLDCQGLRNVTVSNKSVEIGPFAFKQCVALNSVCSVAKEGTHGVNLKSVSSIGKEAFYGCKSIDTASILRLESLGIGSFNDCDNLEYICVSEGLKTLPDNLFQGCNGVSLYLPSTIESIGNGFDRDATNVSLYLNTDSPSKSIFSNWDGRVANDTTHIYISENIGEDLGDIGATVHKVKGATVTTYIAGTNAGTIVFIDHPTKLYALHGSKVVIPFKEELDVVTTLGTFGIAHKTGTAHYLDTGCSSGDAVGIYLKKYGSNDYYDNVYLAVDEIFLYDTMKKYWHESVGLHTDPEIKGKIPGIEATTYSFKMPTVKTYGDEIILETIDNYGTLDYEYRMILKPYDDNYRSETYGAYLRPGSNITINEYIVQDEAYNGGYTFEIRLPTKYVTIKTIDAKGVGNSENTVKSGTLMIDLFPNLTGDDEFIGWRSDQRGETFTDLTGLQVSRTDETFRAVYSNQYTITIKHNEKNCGEPVSIKGPYTLTFNDGAISAGPDGGSMKILFDSKTYTGFDTGKKLRSFVFMDSGDEGKDEGETVIAKDNTTMKGIKDFVIIEIEDIEIEYEVVFDYRYTGATPGDTPATTSKTYTVNDMTRGNLNDYKLVLPSIPLPIWEPHIYKGWTLNDSEKINEGAVTIDLISLASSNPSEIHYHFSDVGYNILIDFNNGDNIQRMQSKEYSDENILLRIDTKDYADIKKAGYVSIDKWYLVENGNQKEITPKDGFVNVTKTMIPANGKAIYIEVGWKSIEYPIFGIDKMVNGTDEKTWIGGTKEKGVEPKYLGAVSIGGEPFRYNAPSLTGYKPTGWWIVYESSDNNSAHVLRFGDKVGFALTDNNLQECVSDDGKIYMMPEYEEAGYGVEFKLNGYIDPFDWTNRSYCIGDIINLPDRVYMSNVIKETNNDLLFDGWYSDIRREIVTEFKITHADLIKNADLRAENVLTFEFIAMEKDAGYSISYNPNTGSDTDDSNSILRGVYKRGAPVDLEDHTAEKYLAWKPGYRPVGWGFTESGPAAEIKTFDDRMVAQAAKNGYTAVLYLVWEPLFYNITYSLDGGSLDLSTPKKGYFDIETSVTAPTKNGYLFAGWAPDTGSDFDGDSATYWNGSRFIQWNASDTPVTDRFKNLCSEPGETATLKATWAAATYKLVFNLNGGSGDQINDITTSLDDTGLTLPVATGSKAGYAFGGWSLDRENAVAGSGFTRNMADAADEKNTVTLYALWSPYKYKVVINDGSATNKNIDALYGVGFGVGIPEKAGYVFSGWKGTTGSNAQYSNDLTYWYGYSSGSTIYASGFKNLSDNPNSTVNLNAVWALAKYSIVYNANGAMGEVPEDDTVYTLGEEIEMMEPSKEFKESDGNKEFIGWSYDPTSTIPVTLTEFTENLATYSDQFNKINLYAIWVSGSYRVSVDLAGAVADKIPAGWKADGDEGTYYKEVGEGTLTEDVLSEWNGTTIRADGRTFSSWDYGYATVMTNILATAVFSDVNAMYMSAFAVVMSSVVAAGFLFARFERRF